ncbi:hypothetical protein M9Y10_036726 [Tritrichomonas musculus]|uniref:DUF3447 domain-containing protein n=1 Tax=Tritrichomonas musculus TaxID=1915356 RepID=A0ABR2GTU4_9EUKA
MSNISSYLNNMKEIQNTFLDFIENDQEDNSTYKKLIDSIKKVQNNKNHFKSFLHLLVNVSNKHHRGPDFFTKIEKILTFLTDNIQKFFSNVEIFYIFGSNKRILLYFIENKILIVDRAIANLMQTEKCQKLNYPQYFYPEVNKFIQCEPIKEFDGNFEENRKIGENHYYISKLIRNDDVSEFIAFVNRSNLSLSETIISPSIFETNSFLLNRKPTLIEYSAFYGSIQIFNYLKYNKVDLNPSLWKYVIRSQNPVLFQILEAEKIEQEENRNFYIEAIKCHHNETAEYIYDNHKELITDDYEVIIQKALRYYNFKYIDESDFDKNLFFDFIKFDYYEIVDFLIKNQIAEINPETKEEKQKRRIINFFFDLLS